MRNVNSVNLLVALAICLGTAYVNAQTVPPMLHGETLGTTSNGCGVIFDDEKIKLLPTPLNNLEEFRKFLGAQNWTGSCINGLAEGRGGLVSKSDIRRPEEKEYFRGRALPGKLYLSASHRTAAQIHYAPEPGRTAYVDDIANLFLPQWIDATINVPGGAKTGTMIEGVDGTNIATFSGGCYYDPAPGHDCSIGKLTYLVYGVQTFRPPNSLTRALCPNPRSPVGCEELWRSKAGPTIAQIEALAAEVEKKHASLKEEYSDLSLPYEERASTKRATREANAELRAQMETKQLREKQERDVKDAQDFALAEQKEKAAAEKRFQISLSKLNAGELFVMANKLELEAKSENALDARNALISRFPNHPLAATAAQQIAVRSNAPTTAGSGVAQQQSNANAADDPKVIGGVFRP